MSEQFDFEASDLDEDSVNSMAAPLKTLEDPKQLSTSNQGHPTSNLGKRSYHEFSNSMNSNPIDNQDCEVDENEENLSQGSLDQQDKVSRQDQEEQDEQSRGIDEGEDVQQEDELDDDMDEDHQIQQQERQQQNSQRAQQNDNGFQGKNGQVDIEDVEREQQEEDEAPAFALPPKMTAQNQGFNQGEKGAKPPKYNKDGSLRKKKASSKKKDITVTDVENENENQDNDDSFEGSDNDSNLSNQFWSSDESDVNSKNKRGQSNTDKPAHRGRGRPPLNSNQMKPQSEKIQETQIPQNHSGGQQSLADESLIQSQLRGYSLEGLQPSSKDEFIKFQNQRRQIVYQKLDEIQSHRFSDFMEANFNEKRMRELLQELLGGKGKISDDIAQAFRVISKIYCGQLTEEARQVQIEEIAMRYGGRQNLPDTLRIGPIRPYQLQEARRRLIKSNILMPAKPKSMFLRQ